MRFLFIMLAGVLTAASVACDSSSPDPGSDGDALWTECPPYQYDDYDGQACAGELRCSYYTADCANLSGMGWACDCVDGTFACAYHSCD